MTPRSGIEVGAVIDPILRVDIGASLNQCPRNLDPSSSAAAFRSRSSF
jgi:hypothetical protein